jgi:hypothetical protein
MRYEDVFDAPPDVERAKELLRPFDRGSALVTLAKLNALLKTWRRPPDFEMDRKIAVDFFSGAERRAQTFPNPIFFTRLGILGTMRLALEQCPPEGGKAVNEKDDVRSVLSCCVMMNDLTNPILASADATPANILTSAIHLHDSTVRGTFEADIARSLILFEQVQRTSLGNRSIDFPELFSASVGLDPRLFAEMCISIGSRYISLTETVLRGDPGQIFIEPNYFSNTTLPEEAMNRFLSRVSLTELELSEKLLANPGRPLSDLTPFQLNPIIRIADGRFYCLDVAALLDKPGRGMYWTLRDAAPEALWRRLPGAYGELFDAYVASLLLATMAARRYLPNPEFADGDEAFDGLLVEGSDLITLEFKSSVLRADRKYSGDPVQVLAELEKKFVVGDSTGAKGIAQLESGIDRLLSGDRIADIDPKRVGRIYPVMVVLDQAMTAPQVSRYLNDRFNRRPLGKKHRRTITPLTIIDIENYERLAPYIEQYGLGPLLESYYDSHVRRTRDQLIALKPENIPYLKNRPALPERARDGFRRILGELGVRMFGSKEPEEELE